MPGWRNYDDGLDKTRAISRIRMQTGDDTKHATRIISLWSKCAKSRRGRAAQGGGVVKKNYYSVKAARGVAATFWTGWRVPRNGN